MQKKINYKDITIILVAYYPDFTKLMDLIKSIHDNFKIIIIQNCKSELGGVKRIHKNVEIIKNRINSGNGAAINIGLKKTFTKQNISKLKIHCKISKKCRI